MFPSMDIHLKQSRQDTVIPPTPWKGKVIIRYIIIFKYIYITKNMISATLVDAFKQHLNAGSTRSR